MPLALSCPNCHAPLTVRESQFGQLVTRPAYRQPFAVMTPARVPAHLDPFVDEGGMRG